MTEKKRKIKVLTENIKAPLWVRDEINVAASIEKRFVYEVVADAWNAYKSKTANVGEQSPEAAENIPNQPIEIQYTGKLRTLVSEIKAAAQAAEQILGAPEDGEVGLHQQSEDVDAERMSRSLAEGRAVIEQSRRVEESSRRIRADLQKGSDDPKRRAG